MAGDTVSPAWTFCFFDCAAPDMDAGKRKQHRKSALRIGVQREMAVMYQQPHLVPPMKLTVYDRMPATPVPPAPSHLSKMMSQGKNLASRASERASFSIRKRSSSRPTISSPRPMERVPSARRYRPLELSIYAPQNRLSDLPEFDSEAVNFTDDGAIQLPPRALVRSRSQDELRRTPSQRTPKKSKSMIEPTMLHRRKDTASSVISTSRPPSSYDALHSHPVSWIEGSLPGLPPQCHHRNPTPAATILSPMKEEFTPACTPACITIDETALHFPNAGTSQGHCDHDQDAAPAPQIVSTSVSNLVTVAPFKLSRPPTSASAKASHSSQRSPTLTHTTSPSLSSIYSTSTTSYSHSHNRAPSSSTSISTTTTRSFAEHRRKRCEFYQVRMPEMPPAVTTPLHTTSTRIPFTQTFQRQRGMSGSTIVTVDTDIMDDDGDAVLTQDVKDRVRALMGENEEKTVEPAVKVQRVDMPDVYAKEIGVGVMRSPGVGLAF